jgi:hypothetical protein
VTRGYRGIWVKTFPGAPFWREAYHAIFRMHNHLGPKDKALQFQPFDVDVDPWAGQELAECPEYVRMIKPYISDSFLATYSFYGTIDQEMQNDVIALLVLPCAQHNEIEDTRRNPKESYFLGVAYTA